MIVHSFSLSPAASECSPIQVLSTKVLSLTKVPEIISADWSNPEPPTASNHRKHHPQRSGTRDKKPNSPYIMKKQCPKIVQYPCLHTKKTPFFNVLFKSLAPLSAAAITVLELKKLFVKIYEFARFQAHRSLFFTNTRSLQTAP